MALPILTRNVFQIVRMRDYLFPRQPTRSDFVVAGPTAIGLASARRACDTNCFRQRKNFIDLPNLAPAITLFKSDRRRASYLGDGKGADERTNRPYSQTNPKPFAAPHALARIKKYCSRLVTSERAVLAPTGGRIF